MQSFKKWLSEMATLNFGGDKGHRGKDHTDVPIHYLNWMKDQINKGTGNFNVTDNGRRLTPDQQLDLISKENERRSGGFKQSYTPPIQTPQTQQLQSKPVVNNGQWIWATSLIAKPEYNIPAPNLDLAMKQSDINNWMFVILDKEEGRILNRGMIPVIDIKNVIKSGKDENGNLVKGNKPSDILKLITTKKKSSSKTIADEYLTPEQKAIEEKFQAIISNNSHSHVVISALAGSGKTSVLKHLAWKYSSGKKWLYLVFNSINKQEAKEEFPPNVQVETTNSWAGRELLGKNTIVPTDRIQDYSDSDKSRIIADSQAFKTLVGSLGIKDQDKLYGSDPKSLDKTDRNLWYIIRGINSEFKTEVLKLLGLCKSFAVDSRSTDNLEKSIREVMSKYDLNTELSDSKEKIEKNSSWAKSYVNREFGYDFFQKEFSEEIIKATVWMMQQSLPNASKETFQADTGKHKGTTQNLGSKRDFDDDLWFSAIHADELKWPKYDVVLADEVQDFNVAQQIILKKLSDAGAVIVAVGDKNQSIYRFRGADSNAFAQLEQMLKNRSEDQNISHELTSNFRSRQSIIDMVNGEGKSKNHVSNLIKGKPFKEGPGKLGKGMATSHEMKYDAAFDTLNSEMKEMGEVKQTAFLSRTNEPLVHASLKLMKLGIPFVILGKDIANDLNKHIDKIIGLFHLRNESSIEELQNSLSNYSDDQVDKHAGKAAMAGKLKELKETTEAMVSSIDQFKEESPDGTVFDFRKWLRNKFGGLEIDSSGRRGDIAREEFKKQKEQLNPVILTTVHKSKGLQFHRVYILRDDLWPHPRSERDEDKEQELNNRYIGLTRAEDELHILDPEGQPGFKKTSEE